MTYGFGGNFRASCLGVVKRLASPLSMGNLQMLLVEIDPGAGSGESGYSHAGEECGIVQEGILNLWIEGEKHTLSQGDSFHFASTKIHRFENPGNVLPRVLWITSRHHHAACPGIVFTTWKPSFA